MDEKRIQRSNRALPADLTSVDNIAFPGNTETFLNSGGLNDEVQTDKNDLLDQADLNSQLPGKRKVPTPEEVFGKETTRKVPTPEEVFGDSDDESMKKLYDGLKADQSYTKSFDEFKAKYSNTKEVDRLYNGIFADGDYTKSKDEFYKQYFPSIERQTKKPTKPSPFGFEASKVDFNDLFGSLRNDARMQVAGQEVDVSGTFGPQTPEAIKKQTRDLSERVKTGNVTKADIQSLSSLAKLPAKVVELSIKDPEEFQSIVKQANREYRLQYLANRDKDIKRQMDYLGISVAELMNNPSYGDAVLFRFKDSHDRDLNQISEQHPFMRINANAPVKIPRQNDQEYEKKVAYENNNYNLLLERLGIAVANEYAKKNPNAAPLEIGLQYERFANPERFKLRQKAGSGPQDRDIYMKGLEALYASGNYNAISMAERDEQMVDDLYPDKKNMEIYHKLGAELYKKGKDNLIYNSNPTPADLIVASQNLSDEDRSHFMKHILPVEVKNIGTNVPVSGAINKFGEGIATTSRDVLNSIRDIPIWKEGIQRTEKEQAQDLLNEPYDTRYQNVGESPEAIASLNYLNTKAVLTDEEKIQKAELERYTNIRSTASEIFDGSGNLAGQVFVQAIATRGLGGVFSNALKGAGLLKMGRAIQAISTEEAIANAATDVGINPAVLNTLSAAITSYASTYDMAKRASLQVFPDDVCKRRLN